MKILYDTSVLVAALVSPHPQHIRALPWLKKARDKEFELVISSHSIAELYAVLSSLPVSPRLTPALAWRLIHESVLPLATTVTLSSSDYVATVRRMSELGVAGGTVYDALIAKVAQKIEADQILTFSVHDFKRVLPDDGIPVVAP